MKQNSFYCYDPNGNLLSLKRQGNINNTNNLMDNFIYNYTSGTNKLNFVGDDVPAARYHNVDIDGQSSGNYVYDEIGQMTEDKQQNIVNVYDAYGKVTEIKDKTSNNSKVKYYYDDKGFRVKKETYGSTGIQHSTWYVRDAAGNTMSIYEKGHGATTTPIAQTEVSVYGMSRIGMYYPQSSSYTYEITDHLGNMRAQISRNKTASGNAEIFAYSDYDPWGMGLPGRIYKSSLNLRYGYQGLFSEKEEEFSLSSFQFRNYDARIGRWLSKDKAGQFHSSYLAMANNPISFVDPDGRWVIQAGAALVGGIIGVGSLIASNEVNIEDLYNFHGESWGKAGVAFGIGALTGLAISTGSSALIGHLSLQSSFWGQIGVASSVGFGVNVIEEFTRQAIVENIWHNKGGNYISTGIASGSSAIGNAVYFSGIKHAKFLSFISEAAINWGTNYMFNRTVNTSSSTLSYMQSRGISQIPTNPVELSPMGHKTVPSINNSPQINIDLRIKEGPYTID